MFEQPPKMQNPEEESYEEKKHALISYAETLGLTKRLTSLYEDGLFTSMHGTITFEFNNGSRTEFITYKIQPTDTLETIMTNLASEMQELPEATAKPSFTLDLEGVKKETGEESDIGYTKFSDLHI